MYCMYCVLYIRMYCVLYVLCVHIRMSDNVQCIDVVNGADILLRF